MNSDEIVPAVSISVSFLGSHLILIVEHLSRISPRGSHLVDYSCVPKDEINRSGVKSSLRLFVLNVFYL